MEREGAIINLRLLEHEVGRFGRTDTAFDDQVACLFGTGDIAREEFCICDVCVCACVYVAWVCMCTSHAFC